MADIFVLQGFGNTGKSTTLIKLCHLLQIKNGISKTLIKILPSGKPKDIKEVITNKDGKNIGITSHGDDPERIKKEVGEFIIKHCDIIFCACHSEGSTVDAVNTFASGNTIDFTQQVIQKNTTMQDKCNDCMADLLRDKAGL